MATAEQLVVRAYRLLGAIDIMEDAPSSREMTIGLETMQHMIDAWSANSLNIADRTITGTTTADSTVVTSVSRVDQLAPGLNISGTGVSARIASIDTASQITLDTAATASGTVSLACTALPFEAKYEKSVAALLAIDLAPMLRIIPSKQLTDMAKDGWSNLTANFMVTPFVVFDKDIMFTSIRRDSGVITGNG